MANTPHKKEGAKKQDFWWHSEKISIGQKG
jgi:hypothetical protein